MLRIATYRQQKVSYSKARLLLSMLILACILFGSNSYGQNRKSKLNHNDQTGFVKAITTNWSLAADAGICSYYGDMSQFDYDYIYKISNESRVGNSISIANKFMPFLSLQAQMTWGRFKASYEGNNRFVEGATTQYSANLLIDFVSLFSYPNQLQNDVPIYPYGILGWGLVNIQSKLYNLESGQRVMTTSYQRDGANEGALTFGVGLNIYLYNDFDFYTSFTYNRLTSDKLDVRVANNPNDYYVYFAFGLKYNIPSSSESNARYKKKGNYRQRSGRR